jgi:DNA-binding YbaB/EbfC family protein
MVNMNLIMKQMQGMQQKITKVQEEIAQKEFDGSSGGGVVKVTITGKGLMSAIKIDPSLLDKNEIDILEDLVIAAFNDARKKLDDETEGTMSGMMPAGLKLPF